MRAFKPKLGKTPNMAKSVGYSSTPDERAVQARDEGRVRHQQLRGFLAFFKAF